MRLSIFLLVLILFALGCNVYAVADRVQNAERLQARIVENTRDEQEGIRVLSAEWTYLTNPDRLQKLATAHFGLASSDGTQYVELAAIPMRDFMDKQALEAAPLLAANTKAQKKQAVTAAPVDTAPLLAATALPQAAQSLPELAATPVSATSGVSDE